jgi:hypothetical protein
LLSIIINPVSILELALGSLLSVHETLSLLKSIFLNDLDHGVDQDTDTYDCREKGKASKENKDIVEEVPALWLHLAIGSLS